MGWGRLLFDGDLLQRLDIEATKEALRAQGYANARTRGRMRRYLEELEGDVGTLALVCRTLMRLMLEKGVLSRAEIVTAMRAIDAQDGKVDGRFTGRVDAP